MDPSGLVLEHWGERREQADSTAPQLVVQLDSSSLKEQVNWIAYTYTVLARNIIGVAL